MSFQKNAGTVKRFSRIMKLASWLEKIPNRLTPPPFRLMQIGSAFWQSKALYVAVRLDIATAIGDESLSIDMIADRVSTHPEVTFRLLRMLVSMGIFEEVSPRQYKNNKLSGYLRQDCPKNVRSMILLHNSDEMSRPWSEQLENGIRSGTPPFELVYKQALFPYMDSHSEFDSLFSSAMDCVEALAGNSFVTDFDWGRFDRIIDVGGSKGSKSLAILREYSNIISLVIDRDQIIDNAQQYWVEREDPSLLARVSFQAGDVFSSIPTAENDKDIFFLSAVLHIFDDDTCIKALQNLAKACNRTGARIALLEMVVAETKADFASTTFDMQMFIGTRGKERTLKEWRELFKKSGLYLEEEICLRTFGKILLLQQS